MGSLFLILALSYVIGSFPTSIIVARVLRGIDIRQHGSGNAGGTNVFRVLGPGPGIFVMAVDIFKGFAATYWVSQIRLYPAIPFEQDVIMILAGCAVVAGHIWTVFARFRGGKGVGTAAGMLLALYPLALLICIGVFFIVLRTTRIMSLASMSAAVALPLVLSVFRFVYNIPITNPLYIFSIIMMTLILFTHRSNIKRLLKGEEFKFGKNKKK